MKTQNSSTNANPTSTGSADPAPAPATKTVHHPGLLDKEQLAEISLCNTINGIASDPAVGAKIQDDQIVTPDFMAQFDDDLSGINQYTGGASEAKLGAITETDAEITAKKDLLAKIHYIQSKAKIKYPAHSPQLAEYSVGAKIKSRPSVETAGGNILNKLKTDTLPKITAQHSADLKTSLDNYKSTKVAQVSGKGDATDLKNKLAQMVESLAERRRLIQHAADGEYPFTDPASAGMRQKFALPHDGPFRA